MSNTLSVPTVGEVTIASVLLPLRSNGGMPPGCVRLLVCEEGREKYSVLAGRLEFSTGLVSGFACEGRLGDDVVLSFRDGYLEEVLVNRMSPDVDLLIDNPTGIASPLTVEALRCIKRCWNLVSTMSSLAQALHTHEARSVRTSETEALVANSDDAWTVLDDQIQVNWITV